MKPCGCLTCVIDRHADKIAQYIEELKMSRLEEKMRQVAGIADRVTTHLETRADAVLEREPKILTRSEVYFAAKNAILDEADKALDDAETMLAQVSNDPLPVPDVLAPVAVAEVPVPDSTPVVVPVETFPAAQ